jgi:hypothetical protein
MPWPMPIFDCNMVILVATGINLHLSFLVDKWLQFEWCNSLRQLFDVALQQIFLLQPTRKHIATNTWLQEQTLQQTNLPNATNTSLQDHILQRTK